MLNKIKVYGRLARFLGQRTFEAEIKSPIDAFKFLLANYPKLEAHMSDKYYKVLVGENNINQNEIHNPIGKSDVHIVPVISGAGGGTGRALLGVGLIAGAFLFSPLTLSNFGSTAIGFGSAAGIAKGVAVVGAALALNGVSEMLFPMPKPVSFDPEDDPRISFSFSGIQNTSRAGTPIPIVYGEILTGSVGISAGVDTNQIP